MAASSSFPAWIDDATTLRRRPTSASASAVEQTTASPGIYLVDDNSLALVSREERGPFLREWAMLRKKDREAREFCVFVEH